MNEAAFLSHFYFKPLPSSDDIVFPCRPESIALVLADHFVWFFWFASVYHSLGEVASFFGICVWIVPFLFFISLSANEFTLPLSG